MPIDPGQTWSYLARSGLQGFSDHLRVAGEVPIGDFEGWELRGELGDVHLGWHEGRLYTDQMAGARFVPPLPVLAPGAELVSWRGWVDSLGRHEPAMAKVTRDRLKSALIGQPVDQVRSIVDLKVSSRLVQLQTWFAPGIGIVKQEQWTNGRLDLSLSYLGKG